MREDMFKVIVERPRLVNSNAYKEDGRQFRNDEENGTRLGIKKGYAYSKGLNENLAPLRRFLEKQVNRPWDKVYAEIREQIDPRSTASSIFCSIWPILWQSTPIGRKRASMRNRKQNALAKLAVKCW